MKARKFALLIWYADEKAPRLILYNGNVPAELDGNAAKVRADYQRHTVTEVLYLGEAMQ